MTHGDIIVLEEAERQFEFIQALKKLDFFKEKNSIHFEGYEYYDIENNNAAFTELSPLASNSVLKGNGVSSNEFQEEDNYSENERLASSQCSENATSK